MRSSDFETLELPRLLEAVARLAVSEAGAAGCRRRRPLIHRSAVESELLRVAEARAATDQERAPLGSFPDIRPLLGSACTEGFILESERCLEVVTILSIVRQMQAWLRHRSVGKPRLLAATQTLHTLPALSDLLDRCLDPEGGLRDEASPELRRIRRRIRTLRSGLEARLGKLLQKSTHETTFADQFVTIRNGRFVVPVRASAVNSLPGVVQDRSSSGETIFIEPLSSVEDNNELLLAVREELEEEARILAAITEEIGQNADSLRTNIETLVDLDGLFARVEFARTYDGICPQITDREIFLPEARHPLLVMTDRSVTAVNIELDEEIDLLVITGPNTGGKSVALKTLGLSALMVQCGIPILAAPEARMPLFDQVFTDIGDRQNVADDLSTFSGHVKNLGEILAAATASTLVLLDEPGTGTDPEDGAALARIILEELSSRGARTLATTHFQTVKVAALSHSRTRVAAVDFHSESFAPQYRLIYDSVGPSLGLTMARRLGFPGPLVQRAEEERSQATADLSAALERLESQRQKLEGEVSEAVAERLKFKAMHAEQERLTNELKDKKQREWSDELGAARRFAEQLRREGRRLLDEAKRNPGEFAKPLVALAREQRKSIAATSEHQAHPANDDPVTRDVPKVGDQVRLRSNGLVGELLEIDTDRARIGRGKIRFDVSRDDLETIGGPATTGKPRAEGGFRVQRATPRVDNEETGSAIELHLIGERVRPALEKLEKFLDQQSLESRESVRVVHGHGTGALRRAVQEQLTISPHVDHFTEAPSAQGGTGATIVYLRG
jgi:DNA mismatch repair protein MutS2